MPRKAVVDSLITKMQSHMQPANTAGSDPADRITAPPAVEPQPLRPTLDEEAIAPTQPGTRRRYVRPGGRQGKPTQFWLQDEDRQLIREFAAWLAGQGVRASDTGVVRAALASVKTGPEYLKIYQQISQLDGRLPRYRRRESQ
jgi:hypothetical protein